MSNPGLGRNVWLEAYIWVYVVFLFLPIALIPLFSFNDSVQAAFPLNPRRARHGGSAPGQGNFRFPRPGLHS